MSDDQSSAQPDSQTPRQTAELLKATGGSTTIIKPLTPNARLTWYEAELNHLEPPTLILVEYIDFCVGFF